MATVPWMICLLISVNAAAIQRDTKWILLDRSPPHREVSVTFAISQTGVDWLEETLKAVSYPASPQYGAYLNFDEIAKHVTGRPDSVKVLVETLKAVGIGTERVDFTLGQDFAVVRMPVKAAESLFATDFYSFLHADRNGWIIDRATKEVALPNPLKGHVDFVFGVHQVLPNNHILARQSDRDPKFGVNPTVIDAQYNIAGYSARCPGNAQAVVSFLQEYFSPADLRLFQEHYSLSSNPVSLTLGYNDEGSPGMEANLDVQYITGIGRNVTTWFVSTSQLANGGQEDFLSWIVDQVNSTNSPWVHSVSYGDQEDSVDLVYMRRLDVEFMKFGVSGRTILFAAGDSGVDCSSPTAPFRPLWPASSRYVTAVGGTTSLTRVWEDGGGGFSAVFPAPEYQVDAVKEYLSKGILPLTKRFNPNGRAYPDISAFATDFAVFHKRRRTLVDGTSCSTPTIAGIVSLLNDARLRLGKKTLGFLNPLLYTTLRGRGFIDVTEGTNSGSAAMCVGFQATLGWDPASGWGSPNFGELKHLVEHL